MLLRLRDLRSLTPRGMGRGGRTPDTRALGLRMARARSSAVGVEKTVSSLEAAKTPEYAVVLMDAA